MADEWSTRTEIKLMTALEELADPLPSPAVKLNFVTRQLIPLCQRIG